MEMLKNISLCLASFILRYKESVQIKHIYNGQDLFPEPTIGHQTSPTTPLKAIEEVLIKIAGAILNLIDKHYSVEVENGDDADNGKRMTVRSLAETISSRMNVRSSSRSPAISQLSVSAKAMMSLPSSPVPPMRSSGLW
nr:senescence/dehydration-associated protein [Quercus suber]